jgi:hypothetical protein
LTQSYIHDIKNLVNNKKEVVMCALSDALDDIQRRAETTRTNSAKKMFEPKFNQVLRHQGESTLFCKEWLEFVGEKLSPSDVVATEVVATICFTQMSVMYNRLLNKQLQNVTGPTCDKAADVWQKLLAAIDKFYPPTLATVIRRKCNTL